MKELERRVAKLENTQGSDNTERMRIDLGDGRVVYATQAEIAAILNSGDDFEAGLGPSKSRSDISEGGKP